MKSPLADLLERVTTCYQLRIKITNEEPSAAACSLGMLVLADATIASPDPQITGQLAIVVEDALLVAQAT